MPRERIPLAEHIEPDEGWSNHLPDKEQRLDNRLGRQPVCPVDGAHRYQDEEATPMDTVVVRPAAAVLDE
jgi:hypothetical protein